MGRTGQLLGQPKEGPKPSADPKEKVPAVEESKGLVPQLARAMRWVWERLLSAPGLAPWTRAHRKWALSPTGLVGAVLPCTRSAFRG